MAGRGLRGRSGRDRDSGRVAACRRRALERGHSWDVNTPISLHALWPPVRRAKFRCTVPAELRKWV